MSRSKGPGCRRKAWSSCARRLKRSVWLRHCSSSSRTRTWAKTHDKPQDPSCAVSTQPRTRLHTTSAQPLGLGTSPQPGCPTAPNSARLRVRPGAVGQPHSQPRLSQRGLVPQAAALPACSRFLGQKGSPYPHHHHSITSAAFSAPWLVTLPQSVTQIPALREVPGEIPHGSQGHLCDRNEPIPRNFPQGPGESPSRRSWVTLARNFLKVSAAGFRGGQGLCLPSTVADLGRGGGPHIL